MAEDVAVVDVFAGEVEEAGADDDLAEGRDRVVSSQESASTGSPLIETTWKSLTWMWNGCVSELVFRRTHSSVAPRLTR